MTYKSVTIWPVIRETGTSKKLIDFCDHSAVDFSVGRISLRFITNFFKHFSVILPYIKYYLAGASYVPTAALLFCLKIISLKLKILFFKNNSANSTRVSVDTTFLSISSSIFLTADNPSSCGILGYKPTTSIVHNKLLSDKFVRE